MYYPYRFFFFFFNDTATTEIYTLSLHDALPISIGTGSSAGITRPDPVWRMCARSTSRRVTKSTSRGGSNTAPGKTDRKSTRLNSSHSQISYAVFCLKKKKKNKDRTTHSA